MAEKFKINCRKIRADDHPFLLALYETSRWDELNPTGWTDDEKKRFLQMQFRLQQHHYIAYYPKASFEIIIVNEQNAGRLYVERTTREIRIIDIILLPEFQNLGIGKKIIKKLLNEGMSKQLPVSLHVEYNNPALKLYERLGFIKKENRGVYYFMEWTPV